MNMAEGPYLGRLRPGPRTLSFSEAELLSYLGAERGATLEAEASTWVAQGETSIEELEEALGDDAEWGQGFADGQALVLCDLIWLTKGIDVPQKGVIRSPRTRSEVDLIICERVFEIVIDLREHEAELQPQRLLEDHRTQPERVAGGRFRYDPEQILAKAIELRKAEGLSAPSIAKRLGISEATLSGYFRSRGIKLSEVAPSVYRSSREGRHDREAIVAAAVKMKRDDPSLSYSQLAKRLGIPTGTLGHCLSKAGVKFRPPDAPVRKYDREMVISESVRMRREEGISQWEAARRLGLPQGTLSMFLRDRDIIWNEIEVVCPGGDPNFQENAPCR